MRTTMRGRSSQEHIVGIRAVIHCSMAASISDKSFWIRSEADMAFALSVYPNKTTSMANAPAHAIGNTVDR